MRAGEAAVQTVTVACDDSLLTAAEARRLIERFGCTCGGEIVPCRLCPHERAAVIGSALEHGARHPRTAPAEHGGWVAAHARHAAHAAHTAAGGEMAMARAMGHAGGMTMEGMVRDSIAATVRASR